MAKKRKKLAEDVSANPLAVVQWGTAAVFSAMIVYNAFFGQSMRSAGDTTASVQAESAKTITIRYDAKVEEAQRQLLTTGHYKGLVDGIVGARTRLAVEAYQKEHELPVTGDVTDDLLDHIRYMRKIAQAQEITGSTAPAPPVEEVVPQAHIKRMQRLLISLGFNLGEEDGRLSGATRAAIRAFEVAQKLEPTGLYSDALMQQLIAAQSVAASGN